ncbi:MAG: heavy-metal-associated domain-containing protein [Planctomycetaceae bacterium]|nr:heavy-metal-associated domain-containing protein [Planctomycetaceae bacterium]
MTFTRLAFIAAPLLASTLVACDGGRPAPAAEPVAAKSTEPVAMSIVVKGMHCEGCEGAICDKVGKVAGVTSVKASHVDEKVDVTAPEERRVEIIAAIKRLGYTVEP